MIEKVYCLNRVKEEWKARLAARTRARPATLRLSLRRCLGESNVVVGPENQTENHNRNNKRAEDILACVLTNSETDCEITE